MMNAYNCPCEVLEELSDQTSEKKNLENKFPEYFSTRSTVLFNFCSLDIFTR